MMPFCCKMSHFRALTLLLDKVALLMKPFLPQLQSTFLKALNDPASRGVRLGAAGALGTFHLLVPCTLAHPPPPPPHYSCFRENFLPFLL